MFTGSSSPVSDGRVLRERGTISKRQQFPESEGSLSHLGIEDHSREGQPQERALCGHRRFSAHGAWIPASQRRFLGVDKCGASPSPPLRKQHRLVEC